MADIEQVLTDLGKNEHIVPTFQDGGRTLVMQGVLADGRVVTATIGWDTLAQAEKNYTNAINGFKERLSQIDGQTAFSALETGVHDSVRNLIKIAGRQIVLFTSVGGDPWLAPKVRLAATKHNSIEIGAGWLYGCFYLGLKRKQTWTEVQEAQYSDTADRALKQNAAIIGALALAGTIALIALGKRK